jgi:hypothetical protein
VPVRAGAGYIADVLDEPAAGVPRFSLSIADYKNIRVWPLEFYCERQVKADVTA